MSTALVADNVAQAADATIRLLPRGDFARLRALGLAGYRQWRSQKFSMEGVRVEAP